MLKKIIYITLSLIIMFTAFSFNQVQADDYIEIYTFEDMQNISNNPDGNYMLMADIDMGKVEWHPLEFNGEFDGNNHTLYNLQLNNLSRQSYITIDWHYNEYDTHFASLFSKCEGAKIMNLNLVNVESNIETDEHCFIASIAGIALDTEIINCHVDARLYLTTTNRMVGIGGMVGFGEGTVLDSSVNLTAVLVDKNEKNNTEEFIGGIWATGYPTIENCNVTMDSYATTLSYTHDGGLIGMHRVYIPGLAAYRNLSDCTVDVTVNYFDHNAHLHRHYGAVGGELINRYLEVYDNTVSQFTENKYKDYDLILEPCMTQPIMFDSEVISFTCDAWGYTIFSCIGDDYTYTDDYTPPQHIAGQWELETEPTYHSAGLMVRRCIVCGEILEERDLPKYVYSEVVTLTPDSLELYYEDSTTLIYEISPFEATDHGVVWASSDTDVVVVDDVGNVSTAGRGKATITCSSLDGQSVGFCEVEVKYTFKQWLIVILLFGWIWY